MSRELKIAAWAEPFMHDIEIAVAAAGLNTDTANHVTFENQGITVPSLHVSSQGKYFEFTGQPPAGIDGLTLRWIHDGPLMAKSDRGGDLRARVREPGRRRVSVLRALHGRGW